MICCNDDVDNDDDDAGVRFCSAQIACLICNGKITLCLTRTTSNRIAYRNPSSAMRYAVAVRKNVSVPRIFIYLRIKRERVALRARARD